MYTSTQSEIRRDIKILQLAKSDPEFQRASELWFKKWNIADRYQCICNIFHGRVYYKTHGMARRKSTYPSTNNCLEATNSVIKKEWTFRHGLAIRKFLNVAFKRIKDWSTERGTDLECVNFKQFFTEPPCTLELQTQAYLWVKADTQVVHGMEKRATTFNLMDTPSLRNLIQKYTISIFVICIEKPASKH